MEKREIFNTHEEAQTELNKNKSKYEGPVGIEFCPLAKCFCARNCAAYNEPFVNPGPSHNSKQYIIFNGYCGSPLITGTITVTNAY